MIDTKLHSIVPSILWGDIDRLLPLCSIQRIRKCIVLQQSVLIIILKIKFTTDRGNYKVLIRWWCEFCCSGPKNAPQSVGKSIQKKHQHIYWTLNGSLLRPMLVPPCRKYITEKKMALGRARFFRTISGDTRSATKIDCIGQTARCEFLKSVLDQFLGLIKKRATPILDATLALLERCDLPLPIPR